MTRVRIPLACAVLALSPALAVAQEAPPDGAAPTAADVAEDAPVPRVTEPPAPGGVPVAALPPTTPEAAALTDEELLAAALAEADGPAGQQAGETIEITETWRGKAQVMRESAEAVEVVETDKAARESADLGEVLARVQGVGVRRAGGLGSAARLTIGGLGDDQVRTFVDGIPIELAGFGLGIANVPVNFLDRIEIYRGVVPVRFGADALGGAVNLVSDQTWHGTQVQASYQVGSFGTHRTTAAARHRTDGGLVIAPKVFFDTADNDYEVEVEVADDRGQLRDDTVARHNDGYRAYGAHLEAGVVDQAWARRLTVLGYATRYDKEIPHNQVMSVPYGEARYGGSALGTTLRWDQPDLVGGVDVETVVGYTWRTIDFVDKTPWIYDWYGQRIGERPMLGEVESLPSDQTTWNHDVLARVHLTRRIGKHHELRATVAPTLTWRDGVERMLSEASPRDPEAAQRDLVTSVVGAEYEIDAFGDRLENIVFVKHYLQIAATEEVLAGGALRDVDRTTNRGGVGDSLRWRFLPWLYGKASYEWSTRLPRSDQIFGDGVLIGANLRLQPELSHNVNLAMAVDASSPGGGKLRAELTGFARFTDQLMVLLGSDRRFSYQNVYSARILGVDAIIGWSTPGEWLSLATTGTFIDKRNVSDEGTFRDFEGDRIPYEPWLQASGSATLQHRDLFRRGDAITGTFQSRFTHWYFRSWESAGRRDTKQRVPTQVLHGMVLTYEMGGEHAVALSAELSNLTDEKAFDFFGVQRPGRALSFKLSGQY